MKNKNKLKYLTLGILLTGAVGFSTLAVKQVQVKAESENVVNINRENKKQAENDDLNNTTVVYDDSNYIITINGLPDNYPLTEFCSLSSSILQTIMFNYENNNYTLQLNENSMLVYGTVELYKIIAPTGNYSEVNQAFGSSLFTQNYTFAENDNGLSWLNDFAIRTSSSNYDAVKQAIETDIPVSEESNYGESIITAISSGLGLIPDLAQEFLTGFTTLFWDSVNEKLTDFGTFALVFLGVAITMAVVKLCLAILRSNTGA